MAISLVAPNSINVFMCSSGYFGAAAGAGAEEAGAAGACVGGALVDAFDLAAASWRALFGNSCSERNRTSLPCIRNTFFSRSIHA